MRLRTLRLIIGHLGPLVFPRRRLPAVFCLALAITACGGDDRNDAEGNGDDIAASRTVTGSAVKGPLQGAAASIHAFDPHAPDGRGAGIDTGSTDDLARISGLAIPPDTDGLLLVEFHSDADTSDVNTGMAPAITRLSTVVPAEEVIAGERTVYATPLTTMAVNVAMANADADHFGGNADGVATRAEASSALVSAQARVKGIFGLGLLGDIDLFTTPPLLVAGTTDSTSMQRAVARHRTAIEAIAAIALRVALAIDDANGNATGSTTTDDAFQALMADIADGIIDGNGPDGAIAVYGASGLAAAVRTLQSTDPDGMPLPNDPEERAVSGVEDILREETESTGNADAVDGAVASADTSADPATITADSDGDGIPDASDTDDDGDGTSDANDAFPLDASEDTDTDGDGVGNNADTDDDGDGTDDVDDAFPLDASEDTDTDGDSVGNNADTDDDGDDTSDVNDAFPLDASEDTDTDGDNDGIPDSEDPAPLDPDATTDTDNDGIANVNDSDDDNDGIPDTEDAFPLDASEWTDTDTDGDGIGNNADTDDDGDGTPDGADAFPLDASESLDTDGDGIGNNTDPDDDNDGTDDVNDAFPLDASEDTDSDGDGIGDNADQDESVTLGWVAPTTREDGSALSLSQIGGYVIYAGNSADDLSEQTRMDSGSAISHTLSNLDPGTYYFTISTFDVNGAEGPRSEVVSTTVE